MKTKHSFTLSNSHLIDEIKEHFKASHPGSNELSEFITGSESSSALVDSALNLLHRCAVANHLVLSPFGMREVRRKITDSALVVCNLRLENELPDEKRRFARMEMPENPDHYGVTFTEPKKVDIKKFDGVYPEPEEVID